ncbi:putative bifunctional diguanylate cyclase/phosphodiesterase [Leeia sp.]|uniref:putative bifunctional diguanylate cyclase/phosphodiesterase n=1 Tax=Leeia sp. TaxID=2884678 RepID=UPI0035B313A4
MSAETSALLKPYLDPAPKAGHPHLARLIHQRLAGGEKIASQLLPELEGVYAQAHSLHRDDELLCLYWLIRCWCEAALESSALVRCERFATLLSDCPNEAFREQGYLLLAHVQMLSIGIGAAMASFGHLPMSSRQVASPWGRALHLLVQGRIEREQRQYAAAITHLRAAVAGFADTGSPGWQALALTWLGTTLKRDQQWEASLSSHEAAAKLAEEAELPLLHMGILANMYDPLAELGRLDVAAERLQQAWQIHDWSLPPACTWLGLLYSNTALLEAERGHFDEALRLSDESIRLDLWQQRYGVAAHGYHEKADILSRAGRHQQAVQALKESFRQRELYLQDVFQHQLDALLSQLDLAHARLEQQRLQATASELEAMVDARTQALRKEMAERALAEAAYRHQASHDSLTGLLNRAGMLDWLQQQAGGQAYQLILLDLHEFTRLNDTLGHQAGDRVLIELAQRLQNRVMPGDAVARIGGGMLLLALKEPDAYQRLRACQQAVALPFSGQDGEPVRIAAHWGGSRYPEDSHDPDLLIRYASIAANLSLEQLSADVTYFVPDMSLNLSRRAILERDLHEVHQRGELQFAYQPIFQLSDQRVVGLELLLRWQHPSLGDVAPAEFIPILEETGLIHPVGDWVLQQGIAQLTAWHQAGANITLAVNISAVQLADAHFEARLSSLLKHSQLPHNVLELELTESALLSQPEQVCTTLQRLAELGVPCSLDDFGTGYSSLCYLAQLPIRKLKVDRSFIISMLDNPASMQVTKAIVSLGHGLGIPLIAEGLDQPEQLRAVATLGCTLGQGFLCAQPMNASDIWALIRPDRVMLA